MITNINASELEDLIKNQPEGLEIIDVRSPEEFGYGHIKGAKLVPVSELAERIGEIDWQKDVIFYCQSGGRSAMASKQVSSIGKNVKNLEGGISAMEVDFLT